MKLSLVAQRGLIVGGFEQIKGIRLRCETLKSVINKETNELISALEQTGDLELKRIGSAESIPVAVHGTTEEAWKSICASFV